MNTYKEYLLEQLPNHLWNMKEKDGRDNRDPLSLKIKSTYIDGFFNYYLFEAKLTTKELVDAFEKDSHRLAEVLYNPWLQKYEQRPIWIKLFEKEIAQNENLFNACIKECLNSHSYLLPNPMTEQNILLIKENFENFKHLVSIGKISEILKNVSQENLQTSYKLYKNYLEEEGLFNSDFSFGKLLNSLENTSNKKEDKNIFFQTYTEDIVNFLSSNPEKVDEVFKVDTNAEKFVNQILTVYDPVHISIQAEFIKKQLLTNQKFRVLLNANEKLSFYKKFPQLVEIYFDNLLPSETEKLYSVELNKYNPSDFKSTYGSEITQWFGIIFPKEDVAKKVVDFKIIDFLTKKIMSYHVPGAKEYTGRAKIKAISMNIDGIKFQPDIESEILSYIEKNMKDLFFKFYSPPKDGYESKKANYTDEDIVNLGKIYKFLDEKKSKLLPSFKSLINSYTKEIVAELFQSDSTQKDRLKIIICIINEFKNPEILTEIINNNNNWNEVFMIEREKRKYVDLPLAFAVLEATDTIAFKWFLETPQLQELADIKYKGKNIIEYLSETPKLNDILNILSENPVAFKVLVLDNKKVFIKLSNHTDERIKKTTTFLNIEEKIAPKKEDVVKIKKI